MHTPWIFNPLRERLTARGIASAAVQLPSSNPDSAAARGLTEDVAVVRAIPSGHSPHLSHSDEVAAVLSQAVTSA